MTAETPIATDSGARARRRAFVALICFVGIVTVKVWVVQFMLLGSLSPAALLLDLLFVFVLFSAVDLAFADLRFRSMLIADAAVSALLAALVVYHAYYGLLPSRESLALMGQATTVGGGIVRLLNPVYLLLFIDIPLIALWVSHSRRKGFDPLTGDLPGALATQGLRTPYVYQRRLVYVVAAGVAILLGFSVRATAASPDAGDGVVVVAEKGVGSYVAVALMGAKDDGSAVAQSDTIDDFQKQVDDLSGRNEGAPRPGFKPGQAKGANVIVIQVEALQTIAVGHSVAGSSVTPNLDELIGQSWYFPNCVSAAGVGTTADVEFVTNTSLYPPPEVGASLGWSDRELTSLPRVLSQYGYESYTFHTNESGFWNRSQFYPALGFTTFFDRTHFGVEDKMAFGSASDRVLFEKTLPELTKARDADRPFYAQVIMMSSHFPFDNVPSDRRTLRPGAPYEGTIVGDYLTEINYADAQLGYFVSELKRTGLWDESVVVVYGDHFGLPEPRDDKEAEALRALAGHDYNDADKALVPLVIHLPGQTSGTEVTSAAGQVDLTPTIADALDADLSHIVRFGRSVLRSADGVIAAGGLLGRGAYADDSVLYVPGTDFAQGRAFDVRTREPLGISAASEQTWRDVKELVSLSREYVAALPLRADYDAEAEITFPAKKK